MLEEKEYGKQCDCWSIGVLLYYLLSGEHPFMMKEDGNEEELFKKIKAAKFSFPNENWSGISNEAKDLISKLLNPNPTSRLTTQGILDHKWFT